MAATLAGGCASLGARGEARVAFDEADRLFRQGDYQAALAGYERIVGEYPEAADRALFEMATIHAHPKNARKDYARALESLQRITADYPASGYRHDGEMMAFYIDSVLSKDQVIAGLQAQAKTLRQDLGAREDDIAALRQQIAALEQKVFAFAALTGPVDRILIEKKARLLKLISKGEVIKSYRVALGGNPEGAKDRQGDNKTPEGMYFIDAKNRDSRYHLSLHISYPNEQDRLRARELGVSPGGDIMIHGIGNGLSWVGGAHADIDWTKGCIAVTDGEIEEIDGLAPVGTPVEIRP
ncbi:MAG: tetratricopeptide repeat protein [Deltaproteobacteria bacterium]|nr:MAG: tetratricopeptide repeat protein [Deltaproteobacteria bacterium]